MSDPKFLSGEVRSLATKCMAGKHDSPDAFGNLISKLLHLTVAKQNEVLRLDKSPHPNTFIFGGALEATDPILHPPSHFQMNAKFIYDPEHRDIHKVHFPARKFSLLDIIRLLAEEFHVPCNKPAKIWQPALAECDDFFHDLA